MSLVGTQRAYKQFGLSALGKAAEGEAAVKREQQMAEAGEKQESMSTAATGAMLGSYFGPWGTAIGAVGGWLAGELL